MGCLIQFRLKIGKEVYFCWIRGIVAGGLGWRGIGELGSLITGSRRWVLGRRGACFRRTNAVRIRAGRLRIMSVGTGFAAPATCPPSSLFTSIFGLLCSLVTRE
jgi:hypothetical protein